MFGGLTIANPAALWAFAAVPLLVLAYLRRRQGRRLTVSSVLILKTLTKRRLIRRKFKPPLRFFVELLALCALIGAGAQPAFREETKQAAVIIDTSLSMRAKDKAGGFERRFDGARAAAKKWIAEQKRTQFTVYSSAPKLAGVGEKAVGADTAANLVDRLEPTPANDNLDAAATELAQNGEFDLVYIATDKEALFGGKRIPPAANEKETRVQVETVGRPAGNLYLTDLRAVRKDDESKHKQVVAGIGFSGLESVQAVVRLSGKGTEQTTSVTVPPNKIIEAVLDVPGEEQQLFKVELVPAPGTANAVTEDDFGWLSTKRGAGNQALVVVPDGEQPSLGLENIPVLNTTVVTAAEYAKKSRTAVEANSLLIFYRTAPADVPHCSSLIVLPPANNPVFPGSSEVSEPKITFWQEDHPITSYLKVPLLTPGRALIFAASSWAQPVINAEPGALLLAGESRGVRFAGAGFEIFPFEGAKTPSLSILTLNLINWLTGGSEMSSSFSAGGTIRLDGGKTWMIKTPAGELEQIEVPPRAASFYTLRQLGVYSIAGILSGGGDQPKTRLTAAVNAFHPLESATYERFSVVVPQSVAHEQKSQTDGATRLWPYLVVFGLLLLVLEILLACFIKEETDYAASRP